MAKFTVEITPQKVTKTLSFMGLDFTEVWEPDENNCWRIQTIIAEKVKSALPNLDEDIVEIIKDFTVLDEDEMMEALETLTDYEKGMEP